MSKVISFRLNEENPREARALAIIKKLHEDGRSTRQIITEALIKLVESQPVEPITLQELSNKLSLMCTILEGFEGGNRHNNSKVEINSLLSSQFIESMKQGIKPGIKHP